MEILEHCEICGKQFDLMSEKSGFNLRLKDLDLDVFPLNLKSNPEGYIDVWICADCWKIYFQLLDLKITWLLLVYIQKIYLVFYKSIKELRIARCKYCNEWFNPKHGNQKYCSKCKDKQRKEYKKRHARELYRSKKIYNRQFPICKYCNKPITPESNKLTVTVGKQLNSYNIDVNYPFIHGNLKYHPNCFRSHRMGYLDKWALNWFEKNIIWLDPRRGFYKYNLYKIKNIRPPIKEYRYIMSTVCYKCREIGAFHIIKKKSIQKDGKMYIYRLKECKNCGHRSESTREHRPKDHWRSIKFNV